MSFLPIEVPELRDYDSGIVLSNLARLAGRQVRLGEAVLSQLWELAGAIRQDAGGDPDTMRSILLSLQDEGEDRGKRLLSDTLPEYRPYLSKTELGGLYERLTLYAFLDEQEPTGMLTLQPLRKVAPAVRGRIAYMTGSLADKAFLQFADRLPDARATDARSFVDACEEVFNGLCQFCILPLESAEEGRLSAFSRLIIRYGLQIVSVCDVIQQGTAGRRSTRFALLCAGEGDIRFHIVPQLPAPRYLELVHTARTLPSVADVLTVAGFCGMSLLRADTLSEADAVALSLGREPRGDGFLTDTDELPLPVILLFDRRTDGMEPSGAAALSVFLRWLSLEAGDDLATGCYGKIKGRTNR